MDKEIDLSKFNIHTDLTIDYIDKKIDLKGIRSKKKRINNMNVTYVTLNKNNALNKKKGKYITIEFDDITDTRNEESVTDVLTKILSKLIKVNHDTLGVVVGLGNINSTPDSLGPLTTNNIIVTNHIYKLGSLSKNYSRVCSIKPSVFGETGIETKDIIESVVRKLNPDYLVVIDSLASSSIERLNKTIQITDTGINPGSGIGNIQGEISKDTLGIPVYAIGVPTVSSASVIVKDTINFIYKNYAYNKENMNKPSTKLKYQANYLNEEIEMEKSDRIKLLGFIGMLSDDELQLLLNEVLNPIGYNYMVTPKEIDFVIKKMSNVISNSINRVLHNLDKKL